MLTAEEARMIQRFRDEVTLAELEECIKRAARLTSVCGSYNFGHRPLADGVRAALVAAGYDVEVRGFGNWTVKW